MPDNADADADAAGGRGGGPAEDDPGPAVTTHEFVAGDARRLAALPDDSVHLVVTSPPYPMVAMWDELFVELGGDAVRDPLERGDGLAAYEAMHEVLAPVWRRLGEVLVEGGIACVVINLATRRLGSDERWGEDRFRCYPNHARVTEEFVAAGFDPLPDVLWRKPTNGPAQFLGSGMRPPNAYPTAEREHVLVFRNGERRSFDTAEETRRRDASAYFKRERDRWFRDHWDDVAPADQTNEYAPTGAPAGGGSAGGGGGGARSGPDGNQNGDGDGNGDGGGDGNGDGDGDGGGGDAAAAAAAGADRDRTAAFPFELPHRLVRMFSVVGDVVCDPFVGTGTTALAAAVGGRHSVSVDIDPAFRDVVGHRLAGAPGRSREVVRHRLARQRDHVRTATDAGGTHRADHYDVPVAARGSEGVRLRIVTDVERVDDAPDRAAPRRVAADAAGRWRCDHAAVGPDHPVVQGVGTTRSLGDF